MAPAAPVSGRTCPNCHAAIPSGGRQCSVCKLDVAKMAAFAAAKRAAQQRGIKTTEVEERGSWLPRIRVSPGIVVLALFTTLLVFGGVWLFKPKPPRYLQFPGTPMESAQKFLTHISVGTDPQYNQAYGMIADSARDPGYSDEIGLYRQLFHVMNLYLSGQFGNDWIGQTQFAADPADPNVIVAHVALETLHIRLADQTPADKKFQGPHFGVLGVDEFNIMDAGGFQQTKAIEGVVGGIAGQGAVNNLEMIRGTGGSPRHETPMQKKVRLLPIVSNPHEASWQAVVNLWPLRKDPVVRHRMELIIGDDRFNKDVQEKATGVLKEKLTEEDFAATGVDE